MKFLEVPLCDEVGVIHFLEMDLDHDEVWIWFIKTSNWYLQWLLWRDGWWVTFCTTGHLKKIPNTDSRLLATRLSAIVSRKILSYGADLPKELLTLSIFLQKGEAIYKKGMMWSSIFGNLW